MASSRRSSSWQLQWRWPPPLTSRLRPLALEFEIEPRVHPWGVLALVLRGPSRLLDQFTTAHHRLLDRVAARLTQHKVLFPSGFFCDGWGDLATPARLQRVIASPQMREVHALERGEVVWTRRRELTAGHARVQEGRFRSTLPDSEQHLPAESREAFCELVTPLEWGERSDGVPLGAPNRPLVVLLPGTGEHGYLHRRTSVALPLARLGVATLILEGPFYGKRRPSDQRGSKLRRVSDLPILGQATIEEAKSLLAYFRDYHNFSNLVVAGSSMGGLHAAMVASAFPGEVGATAWLAPPSAAPVFADGLLSASCNWMRLYKQHGHDVLDGLEEDQRASDSISHSNFEDADPVVQAKKRMRAFLSITDIDNFEPPQRSDAVVFVVGTEDEYIGTTEPQWAKLEARWKAVDVRYVHTGHVSGILLEHEAYRETILEVIHTLKCRPVKAPVPQSDVP